MKEPILTRLPALPLTIRKKIGKMRRVPAGHNFRVRLFFQTYEGTTGIHMDDKIWLYGLHEAATVRLLRDILLRHRESGKKPVYMDIGTNTGMHLLAAAPLAEAAYGFEPWEPVRRKAARNIALNHLPQVTLFDFGLSDENATLPFVAPAENNLGVGMFVDDGDESAKISTGAMRLAVRRGDDVVSEHGMVPTLLKIDVEGHEKKTLTGLRETIARCRPDIVFEYSDLSRRDLSDATARGDLFGEGYRFFGIRRSREFPSLEPFNPAKKYENVLATAEG